MVSWNWKHEITKLAWLSSREPSYLFMHSLSSSSLTQMCVICTCVNDIMSALWNAIMQWMLLSCMLSLLVIFTGSFLDLWLKNSASCLAGTWVPWEWPLVLQNRSWPQFLPSTTLLVGLQFVLPSQSHCSHFLALLGPFFSSSSFRALWGLLLVPSAESVKHTFIILNNPFSLCVRLKSVYTSSLHEEHFKMDSC